MESKILAVALFVMGGTMAAVGWNLGYDAGYSDGKWTGIQEGQNQGSKVLSQLVESGLTIERNKWENFR